MKYELNKLYNEDCLEAMKQIPDKYFDLAIVDPPYGIGANKMELGNGKRKIYRGKSDWDVKAPSKEYFIELKRISKNQIIWGGNYFNLKPSRCFIIWDKLISEDFSLAMAEMAWTSFDKLAKIFRMATPKNDYKIHPTQKPIELYEWLLKNYAKQGDKILDTHVGSASSLIACYNLGFEYVGFELDKEYFDKATQRIEARKNQLDIFHIE